MQRQEYRQKDGDYYYCYYRKRSEVGQATIIREAGVIFLNTVVLHTMISRNSLFTLLALLFDKLFVWPSCHVLSTRKEDNP
jgi:hypothetical protein